MGCSRRKGQNRQFCQFPQFRKQIPLLYHDYLVFIQVKPGALRKMPHGNKGTRTVNNHKVHIFRGNGYRISHRVMFTAHISKQPADFLNGACDLHCFCVFIIAMSH